MVEAAASTEAQQDLLFEEDKVYHWAEKTFKTIGLNRDNLGLGVRVLSLDGGGVKGIVECLVLEKLEELTGRRIWELFDLIVGTSTGAIIALGCSQQKLTASELTQMYNEMSDVIFSNKSYVRMLRKGHMFDHKELESKLKQHFGMQSVPPFTRCCVTASDASSEHRPNREVFFKFYNTESKECTNYSDAQVWEAARASSAAPMILSALELPLSWISPDNKKITRNFVLVDGGMLNNNPVEVAIDEARIRLWPTRPVESLVSIGCGSEPLEVDLAAVGLQSVAPSNEDEPAGSLIGRWTANLRARIPRFQHFFGSIGHVHLLTAQVEPAHNRVYANVLAGQWKGIQPDAYSRISPAIPGISKFELSDASKVGQIANATKAWIESPEGTALIGGVADRLQTLRTLGVVEKFQDKLRQSYLENFAFAKLFDLDQLRWSVDDVFIHLRRSTASGSGRAGEKIESAMLFEAILQRPSPTTVVEEVNIIELFKNGFMAFKQGLSRAGSDGPTPKLQQVSSDRRDSNLHVVVITAPAGHGKTTLSRRLCFLWASERFSEVKLIIAVSFPEALSTTSSTTLLGMIQGIPSSSLTAEERLILLVVCAKAREINHGGIPDADCMQMAAGVLVALKTGYLKPHETVIFIDGIDEVPADERRKWLSFLYAAQDLPSSSGDQCHATHIASDRTPRLHLILASRQEGIDNGMSADCAFDIIPLEWHEQKTFIRHFCQLCGKNNTEAFGNELAESLINVLRNSPIQDMLSTPMFLLMVCVLEADTFSMPNSTARIEAMPLVHLFDSFCDRQYTSKSLMMPYSSWKQSEEMRALHRFAFQCCFVRPETFVGSIEDGRFSFVKKAARIGFLCVDAVGEGQASVSFQHSLFMEFFAAVHITNVLGSEMNHDDRQETMAVIMAATTSNYTLSSVFMRFLIDSKPELCWQLFAKTYMSLCQPLPQLQRSSSATVMPEAPISAQYQQPVTPEDVVGAMQRRLQQCYKNYYSGLKLFGSDEMRWSMDDIDVKLRDCAETSNSFIQSGDFINEICRTQDATKQEQVRQGNQQHNVTVLRAGAGTGKAILIQRLCYLWAKERHPRIKLLIDVNVANSIDRRSYSYVPMLFDLVSIYGRRLPPYDQIQRIVIFALCEASRRALGCDALDAAWFHVGIGLFVALITHNLKPDEIVLCIRGLDDVRLSVARPLFTRAAQKLSAYSFEECQPSTKSHATAGVLFIVTARSELFDYYNCNFRTFEIMPSEETTMYRFINNFCRIHDKKLVLQPVSGREVDSRILLLAEIAVGNISHITNNPMFLQMLCTPRVNNLTVFQRFDIICEWTVAKCLLPTYQPESLKHQSDIISLQRFAYELVFDFLIRTTQLSGSGDLSFADIASAVVLRSCERADDGTEFVSAFQCNLFMVYFANLHMTYEIAQAWKVESQSIRKAIGSVWSSWDKEAYDFARFVFGSHFEQPAQVLLKKFQSYCSKTGRIEQTRLSTFLLRAVSRYHNRLVTNQLPRSALMTAPDAQMDPENAHKLSVLRYEFLSDSSKRLLDFVARQNWEPASRTAGYRESLYWDVVWPDDGLPPANHSYPFLYVHCQCLDDGIAFVNAAIESALRVGIVYSAYIIILATYG